LLSAQLARHPESEIHVIPPAVFPSFSTIRDDGLYGLAPQRNTCGERNGVYLALEFEICEKRAILLWVSWPAMAGSPQVKQALVLHAHRFGLR
jgi:hypothetical protein